MNFTWTTEQERLNAEYAAFGKEIVAPRAEKCWNSDQFDATSWEGLAEMGLWKMVIPTSWGGEGRSWWDFVAAAEGLASTAADGGFVLSVIGQAGFLRALEMAGNEAQQERWFPKLMNGAPAATCIAERHSGTNVAATQTIARGGPDKWTLSGEKWNISHAPDAEMMLVLGRIEDATNSGLSLFLLDASLPGIDRSTHDAKSGNRSLPTGALSFKNVPIGPGQILRPPGKLSALRHASDLQRALYGLLGALLPAPALETAEEFISQRSTGKRPLSAQQYVQQRITEAILVREQALWTGRAALASIFSGRPDASLLGSVAKLSGSQAALSIIREVQALMGSEGYLQGPISRLALDLNAWIAVGGTEEAHRMNIFRQHQNAREGRT